MIRVMKEVVSMPYVGQASFLRDDVLYQATLPEGINALCRASLISTVVSLVRFPTKKFVSMPYVGQASFLQNIMK